MRSAARLALTAACSVLLVGGAPAALAQTADYNGGTDPEVLDNVVTRPDRDAAPARTGANAPTTLPFTGGEIVLLASSGAAAVVAGVALFAGGRRRNGADA